MHVVLYSPAWPPEQFSNGIVTYVHWLRRELARRGHRVTVIAGKLGEGREAPDVHALDAPAGSRAWRWLMRKLGVDRDPVLALGTRLAEQLTRLHRRDPIDVLEMEESFGWFAAVVACKRFPVVVKLHGPAFLSLVEEELDAPTAGPKIEAEGAALAKARVITSPSRCTLDETVARYGLHPAIAAHIVNPVALPSGAKVWSLASARPHTLLFVGRFDKRKGGDRVLLAFKRLLATRPQLELLFVGPDTGLTTDAGPKVHVEAFAAELYTPAERERLRVLGRRSQAEIAELRCQAALTIVASRWESQGYTALEAMLQGCPVVCADTSGLRESVRHEETGLLFDGDDLDAMAARIARLLDDPALAARLGAAARRRIAAVHGALPVVDRTVAVYEAAIDAFSDQRATHAHA